MTIPTNPDEIERHLRRTRLTRRKFLLRTAQAGLAVGAVGLTAAGLWAQARRSPWNSNAFPPPGRSQVAVLPASSYDGDLERVIADGLDLVGLDVRGASVLLKPNLVEFDPASVINTDPRLVAATVAVMRQRGARSVVVGEGSGHRRDIQYIVGASGMRDLLRDVDTQFVDLNTAALRAQSLESHFTSLGELWLPQPMLDADIVVSMPKLKTHHWGGVTLALKNCFGTVPGRVYGWPKNVLHWAGLNEAIVDVAAAVRPDLAIVDGIVGMEGDGPIKGDAVDVGVIIFGRDPVAVDSTSARVMGIDASRVTYLEAAGRFLGQLEPEMIEQLGDDPDDHRVDFALLPQFAHLRIGSSVEPADGDEQAPA